jgi:chromosome segregation protein
MYLKRLELHGFKSFAPPTTFEFGTGVTCIAGPNGSGKTNVAEAIRWVLGEQASKIIRVRKTEEIIFSGSASRPPMGVAEARITLDNADGWLQLPFEEVVVARRAYRSGENEYYVNQGRVRLKDVTELFLKAQVGQNSYAFMGQGLVEQVLTLRPEERRGLIEEAADVRLHRDKLEEARNRLAATRDNLDRVQLLVDEIAPRLRQLERQAGRAEDHARMTAELHEALTTLFGQQWQEAQEALAAALANADQRREAFENARRDAASCEEGLTSLAGAIAERRSDIEERAQALRVMEDEQRDLGLRTQSDQERLALLTSRREELVAEIETLEQEREALAALGAGREERAVFLAEELELARTPDHDMRELQELDQRLTHLRRDLVKAETAVTATAAQLAAGEVRRAAVEQQRERSERELAAVAPELGQQVESLRAWLVDLSAAYSRYAEHGPAAKAVATDLADVESKLERAITLVREQEDALRGVAAEQRVVELQLEAAEDSHDELPAPDAGIRALLAAAGRLPGHDAPSDSRIQGVIATLVELIRVPSGLERAIETALAENLHSVVVETQDDALAAVELLVHEDQGRAVLLPLNDIRPAPPVNLMDEKGVIGVASELVRCDQRFRPLVQTLLGRTIVVENLGVARKVIRRGLGNVVTREGILIQPIGSIMAGSSKPVRREMAMRRDAGTLPEQLEALRAAHQEASSSLAEARREEDDTRRRRDQLAPEFAQIRHDLAAAEDALRQQQSRLPALLARLSSLSMRRDELERSRSEAESALAGAQLEAERAATEAESAGANEERIENLITEAEVAREVVARKTVTRTTRIAALEAEQEALDRQREMHAASIARADETLQRRRGQQSETEEELIATGSRLEATKRELDAKAGQSTAAREDLVPARNELDQLEARQRAMNEELSAARTKSLEAERALLDADATVHLRKEELESLRERLAEEGFAPAEEGIVPVNGDADAPPDWLASNRTGEQLPPMRGGSAVDVVALKERVSELRAGIRKLGPVNAEAGEDFSESKERYEFLSTQLTDLRDAEGSLQGAIDELESIIKARFSVTFERVNKEFKRYFETFFAGGHGELQLTRPDEDGLPGIDVIAQPPRKRVRTLNMLSGGERSLTALALLFALLETNPSPICVLDEVDAALDEANVDRFTQALRQLAERTQFIIITHNRRTLEMADTIYGISMGSDSTSSVLSLRLADLPKN